MKPDPWHKAWGFTLLETMVALLVTGLVALTAYGVAHVSVETRVRLQADLAGTQSARVLRALLEDALRNARAPAWPGETTFAVHAGRLSFVAAGTGPPFDPDYDWRISVTADSAGLEMVGAPVGRAPAAEVVLRARSVTRWDVQVLRPTKPEWVSEWRSTRMPRAIAVTLWRGFDPVGPPLEVTLTPTSIRTGEAEDEIE